MGRLRYFLIISLLLHLVLILALMDIRFSGRQVDTSEVYEVAIVAGVPSGGGGGSQGPSVSQGRKFIYNKTTGRASLGEVRKEQAQKVASPRFSPSEIRPESPVEGGADIQAGPSIKTKGRTEGGSSTAQGKPGGSPSEIALWKASVRGMVEDLWKPPLEIEIMDRSLKTTYLLRVSRMGELLQKRLLVSSGNVPFDRTVLVALSRVSRFPQPPLVLIAGEDWVEVTMSFTPSKGAH